MLTINASSILHRQDDDSSFASKLLDVGKRNLLLDINGFTINTISNYVSSPEKLCTTVHPNLSTNYVSVCQRTILVQRTVSKNHLRSNKYHHPSPKHMSVLSVS